MVALTPGFLIFAVRSAFRLGHALYDIHDQRVLTADAFAVQLSAGSPDLRYAALFRAWQDEGLRPSFSGVFDLTEKHFTLVATPDPIEERRAIDQGMTLLAPMSPLPQWAVDAKIAAGDVVAIHSLLGADAQRQSWARFGRLLVRVGIEAVAAQPNIVGVHGRTEMLLGAFASKVDAIIGPDGLVDDPNGQSFRERAAAVLFEASLSTIAENPGAITSQPHWAALIGNVFTPLAQAQQESRGNVLSFDRIQRLMRGPLAQEALRTISEHQSDFLGAQFGADKAAGAVTAQILSAAIRTAPGEFDITHVFSQRGLTLVYTSALEAAAKRPELFVHGDGRSVESWRELLGSVAGILKDAPPPFDAQTGLSDRLTCAVIDAAANHLTRAALADAAGEGPWHQVTANILKSTIEGFKSGLVARVTAPGGAAPINPFRTLFNQDQVVDIVRIVAAQAAKTPEMLIGTGHRNELFAITQAVAVFMSDPNTRLASSEDWRVVIGVALDEAAKNPGALFHVNPDARPESHLAVTLIGSVLQNAATALRQTGIPGQTTARRRGSVLFGSTLRDAIVMTLHAAANNARALLDEDTHVGALSAFVETLQNYTETQQGRIGAAEYLYLYRTFIADVIERGPNAGITEARLENALRAIAPPAPSAPRSPPEATQEENDTTSPDTIEETSP